MTAVGLPYTCCCHAQRDVIIYVNKRSAPQCESGLWEEERAASRGGRVTSITGLHSPHLTWSLVPPAGSCQCWRSSDQQGWDPGGSEAGGKTFYAIADEEWSLGMHVTLTRKISQCLVSI